MGVAARRGDLLEQLCAELSGQCVAKVLDVAQPQQAIALLKELVAELVDVDTFVISAAIGSNNPDLEWPREEQTLMINVVGAAAMINVAVEHLQTRGGGRLVGLSSVAALRGIGLAPAYSASKAFLSNYLHGLRYRFMKRGLPISVTDVQPGFVDTRMAGGKFWMASTETAAREIIAAAHKGRAHVYVTPRWRLIAWLMRIVPDALWGRLSG